MVSLTRGTDAAAGFYIPLAPPLAQKIFPHSFKISYANYTRTAGFCSWQIPCLLLLTAHKIRLFCCRLKLTVERGTAPFQRQRSQKVQHTRLCKQNRVPTGILSPLLETQSQGIASLWTPAYFPRNGTQTVKMQFDTFPQKIQNRCNLHPCRDENCSGFYACHTVTRMQECILRSHSTFCIR